MVWPPRSHDQHVKQQLSLLPVTCQPGGPFGLIPQIPVPVLQADDPLGIRSMGATVECPHAPWRWFLLSSHPAGEETDSKHRRNLAKDAQSASTQASQDLMLPRRRGPGGGPRHRTCDRWACGRRHSSAGVRGIQLHKIRAASKNSQLPALVLSASWAGSITPLSK